VICPAATFVATATACILVNAIPIVVDIDPANYQIDPLLPSRPQSPTAPSA
jgi:dTDP-4-amino-4,6-dideoxygalactose transaminase